MAPERIGSAQDNRAENSEHIDYLRLSNRSRNIVAVLGKDPKALIQVDRLSLDWAIKVVGGLEESAQAIKDPQQGLRFDGNQVLISPTGELSVKDIFAAYGKALKSFQKGEAIDTEEQIVLSGCRDFFHTLQKVFHLKSMSEAFDFFAELSAANFNAGYPLAKLEQTAQPKVLRVEDMFEGGHNLAGILY